MLTDIQELLVFQAVAKHASYARAAEELGLSPSGVSRVVTRPEERLGARLVQEYEIQPASVLTNCSTCHR